MSYEKLREECNRRLPERDIHAPATIADVLKILDVQHTHSTPDSVYWLSQDGGLWYGRERYERVVHFNLAAPLSDPSNAAACEAVLSIITGV